MRPAECHSRVALAMPLAPAPAPRKSQSVRAAESASDRSGSERQVDAEGRPFARRALHHDVAARCLHDLADDPQAEAETAVVSHGRRTLEALEDSRLQLRLDPN